jgi:hypothetical protein
VAAANPLLDRSYGKSIQPISQMLAKVNLSSISESVPARQISEIGVGQALLLMPLVGKSAKWSNSNEGYRVDDPCARNRRCGLRHRIGCC